jgi:hypothetical protein
MRRILLLLAVAAMMAVLMASSGPAFGAAREPTFDGPGDPQTPENTVDPTKSAGQNCYGKLSSTNVKGPGGNPGSLAEPTEFPEGTPNYTGHAVSTLEPGDISGFQLDFRDDAAAQSC